MADSSSDQFSAARSNLRDTVKWLAAALAGVVAAALGTSPLTALGSLNPADARFQLAVGFLALALACFVGGIAVILDLLIADTLYLEEARNYQALLDVVTDHCADLLPPEYQSLVELLDERNTAAALMRQNGNEPAGQAYAAARARYDRLKPTLLILTGLLQLEKFRLQVRDSSERLLLCTVAGVIFLGIYAWAANPPKAAGANPTHASSLETGRNLSRICGRDLAFGLESRGPA